ncbi:MAG: LysE family translocator [Pseudomonadota bacterium]
MPPLELLLAFFAAAAVFAYMPGPAMIYATAQTIARGRRAGFMASLGIHLGGYVHVIAAAFGLAALFEAVPVLYFILKLAGAAYLIVLGLAMILTRTRMPGSVPTLPRKSARRAFYESITVEVLNPKTAVFYLAFLPQFTSEAATLPLWAQLIILGTIVNIMFSSADLVCVALADRIKAAIRSSHRTTGWAKRVAGGLLIGLGVNLALQRQ